MSKASHANRTPRTPRTPRATRTTRNAPTGRQGLLARLWTRRTAHEAQAAAETTQAAETTCQDPAPLSAAELRATAAQLREIADGFAEFAEQLARVESVEAAGFDGQEVFAWQMRLAIRAFCPSMVALFETLALRCTPVAPSAQTEPTETTTPTAH